MTGSCRASTNGAALPRRRPPPGGARRGPPVALRAILGLAALAGCVEHEPGVEGTTSLQVEILSPADLGAVDRRLADTSRSVQVRVTAKDAQNEVDVAFSGAVDVRTHFLGSLTPGQGTPADLYVVLQSGVGEANLTLPGALGPTYLWVEDTRADGERAPSYATGTSPTLWFREPWLEDVSRPSDESADDALERSPLEGKQVRVETSRFGAAGSLMVTGIYTQGYTVSDVDCSTLPCAATDYGHVFVFTFNRPRAEPPQPGAFGKAIEIGDDVSWVGGGVGEFNGFTELNFPQTVLIDDVADEARLPAPAVLQGSWLADQTDMINLERVESALVAVEGATLCPLDENFTMYMQWKLDVGLGCGRDVYNVISSGTAPTFDPGAHEGQTVTRVVGTLRAVNIGSFHVWILYPRRESDIVL